jgi:hypothetical protein
VSVSSGRRWGRFAGLGALSLALLAAPALVATSADALPVPGPDVPCLQTRADGTSAVRRAPDTSPVTAATVARVERAVRAATQTAEAQSRLTASAVVLPVYRVKVQIHIIHGKKKADRRLHRHGARKKVFRILRTAYNGGESAESEPMGIDFRLKRITVTTNDRWYHARMNSSADRQMKRRLHRGTAQTLNIYINKPRPPAGFNGLLLGYSRFPWQYRRHKTLDGVTINVQSLPIRGSRTGFNLGDTAVHETGHWLGLFHTFQGFCDSYNDGVADTPAESDYAASCTDTSNICDPNQLLPAPDGPGYFNPALNFMEYTPDACMRMFTAGQHTRVAGLFAKFRYHR